ncbi:hypothetical protein B4589_007260 [Halolamina sp. CBA1230]|uniref:hypothetical protein n=1 Tax=Halolamina sp. CBA1230 TaxID=1853690 RepID=UPI0009A17DB4|nr:hypothetical protein [Halolamina sp. CBA1230]QKY20187.1 hypothetical protein B4589_007260 [Halolamina sp. CBA1230]
MATATLIAVWILALGTLGVGAVLAFRVERALALQERFAEWISWVPPSENPAYYDDTREYREWTFRFGGAVLLVVGCLLLAVAVYGTVFVESFPA